MNQLISDGGDCRTAPATPGLLNIGSQMYIRPVADRFYFAPLLQSQEQEQEKQKPKRMLDGFELFLVNGTIKQKYRSLRFVVQKQLI